MHERKNSWMDKEIDVTNPQMFIEQIRKIFESNPKEKIKTLEEKKQEVLRKIQDNFMCEDSWDNEFRSDTRGTDFNKFADQFINKNGDIGTGPSAHKYNAVVSGGESPKTYSSPS